MCVVWGDGGHFVPIPAYPLEVLLDDDKPLLRIKNGGS